MTLSFLFPILCYGCRILIYCIYVHIYIYIYLSIYILISIEFYSLTINYVNQSYLFLGQYTFSTQRHVKLETDDPMYMPIAYIYAASIYNNYILFLNVHPYKHKFIYFKRSNACPITYREIIVDTSLTRLLLIQCVFSVYKQTLTPWLLSKSVMVVLWTAYGRPKECRP